MTEYKFVKGNCEQGSAGKLSELVHSADGYWTFMFGIRRDLISEKDVLPPWFERFKDAMAEVWPGSESLHSTTSQQGFDPWTRTAYVSVYSPNEPDDGVLMKMEKMVQEIAPSFTFDKLEVVA
jgi:hypothetical protein